jgi:hypothetical protein
MRRYESEGEGIPDSLDHARARKGESLYRRGSMHVVRSNILPAVSLAAIAILAAPGPWRRVAWANAAAASFSTPGSASGSFLTRPTRLEVEREELAIRCDEERGTAACRFVATYHLHNPTPDPEDAEGAFFGSDPRTLSIRLDGGDVRARLAPEEMAELGRAVGSRLALDGRLLMEPWPPRDGRAHLPESAISRATPPTPQTGFRVRLGAGARAELVFAGPLDAVFADNPRIYEGFAIPAHQTRHVALASSDRREARFEFVYFLAPMRTWAGARDIAIEIDVPAGWRLAPTGLSPAAPPWTTALRAGRVSARASTRGDASGPPRLAFEVTIPRPRLLNGGPFLAAGGALGAAAGLRLRAGYEVAGPSWLLYGLALETNARDLVSGALVVQAASPGFLLVIPSLALGAGAIVEHRRAQTAAGVRVETAVSFPVVSAVLHLDLFPAQAGAARWALLGQVSF